MNELVKEARAMYDRQVKMQVEPDARHQRICQEIAMLYDLWDVDDLFPVWLSRVVEGVIRDIEETQTAR